MRRGAGRAPRTGREPTACKPTGARDLNRTAGRDRRPPPVRRQVGQIMACGSNSLAPAWPASSHRPWRSAERLGNHIEHHLDALMMAVWRRGKADALLHHSDRGSHYTSERFQPLLLDHGITRSMRRAGNG